VSYSSTSATFTVIDTDNNLSKIEWYLDDVLKETITTDLTAEKTINYELTDNAIHTLKIVATDAENATVEKVLSISKEIMPLQSDASLSDISTKLIEIGEGFKNGKTSIINTLALKNIEASLNNTLVELSEKIKTSFDSSDASVQDLMNQLTQANNTISQLNSKYKYASGTVQYESYPNFKAQNFFINYFCKNINNCIKLNNIGFIPNIFIVDYSCVVKKINYKYTTLATNFLSQSSKDFVSLSMVYNSNSSDALNEWLVLCENNNYDVYINNNGVCLPALNIDGSDGIYKWYALKFL
ncbi:TPA: hypothetical protein ACG3JU_003561, partial [Clostridioides difficile]